MTTATYRLTERQNDTDELIRVVSMLSDVTFAQARAAESEAIATDGNHIRLEKWNPSSTDDSNGSWEYL